MTDIDTTTETPAYVTPRDAADMLGVSTQAVYRLISRGSLPAERPWPRKVLIPLAAVLARIEGTQADTSISRRECREFVLADTGAASTDVLLPSEVERSALEFICDRRPAYSEDEQRDYARVMSGAILAGRR